MPSKNSVPIYTHTNGLWEESFLFLIFAKNWYNCLLCLTLNFGVLTMDLGVCLFVLQKGITRCSPDPLVSFLFLPNSKFSGGAQTFLAWNTSPLFFVFCFFGCVGSSFLCEGFLQLWQVGATLHRDAQASHYHSLSCCGAQAPDAQAQ